MGKKSRELKRFRTLREIAVRAHLLNPISRSYEKVPVVESWRDYKSWQNYSLIQDAVVGIENGIGFLPAALISRECHRYGQEVFIQDKNGRSSGNDSMKLLCLEVLPGSRVDIFVKGVDDEPQSLAKRIYAGITTKGERPDFDRLG